MKYTIDAQGKKIGRIASEAAAMLSGKNLTSFARNKASGATVEIINASRADITAKKKQNDIYVTYTGHRGGLNKATLGEVIEKAGMAEVFRRAVYGMLPSNKLRAERIKNLTIKE